MNHTKEPWSYDQPFDKLLIKTEDEEIARLSLSYYGLDNKAHANAKRIVACVNACAGIRTEALESGLIKYLLNDAYMRTLNPFDPNPQSKMDMKYLGKPVYEEDFEEVVE